MITYATMEGWVRCHTEEDFEDYSEAYDLAEEAFFELNS